jgi:tetratricopeptide (TPR) repeat protein
MSLSTSSVSQWDISSENQRLGLPPPAPPTVHRIFRATLSASKWQVTGQPQNAPCTFTFHDDRDKAKLLINIANELLNKKPTNYQQRRIFYLLQGLSLNGISNECKLGFYLNIGAIFLDMGDSQSALTYFKAGTALLHYEEQVAKFYIEVGKIYLTYNKPDEALTWLDVAKKYTKKNDNLKHKINSEIIKALNKKIENYEKSDVPSSPSNRPLLEDSSPSPVLSDNKQQVTSNSEDDDDCMIIGEKLLSSEEEDDCMIIGEKLLSKDTQG